MLPFHSQNTNKHTEVQTFCLRRHVSRAGAVVYSELCSSLPTAHVGKQQHPSRKEPRTTCTGGIMVICSVIKVWTWSSHCWVSTTIHCSAYSGKWQGKCHMSLTVCVHDQQHDGYIVKFCSMYRHTFALFRPHCTALSRSTIRLTMRIKEVFLWLSRSDNTPKTSRHQQLTI